MIRLAPAANPKNALQMVTDAATKLANVLGSGTAFDQYNKYLEWASQQGNVLSYQLHTDELTASSRRADTGRSSPSTPQQSNSPRWPNSFAAR